MAKESVYNLGYYEDMLKNYSETAKKICSIRWEFIAATNPKTVLDYGSGVGWFRAFRPKGLAVDSFDIAKFPQTGINHKRYDLVCLWDVLEHLESFSEIEALLHSAKFVATTVPILPSGKRIDGWKHFKPGEHIKVFTHDTINALFNKYDYVLIKKGQPECPPREDIWSFLYGKSGLVQE